MLFVVTEPRTESRWFGSQVYGPRHCVALPPNTEFTEWRQHLACGSHSSIHRPLWTILRRQNKYWYIYKNGLNSTLSLLKVYSLWATHFKLILHGICSLECFNFSSSGLLFLGFVCTVQWSKQSGTVVDWKEEHSKQERMSSGHGELSLDPDLKLYKGF